MQTQLKRLFSAILVLAMVFAWYVPSTVSAEDTTSELLFKEDFGIGTDYSFTSWSGATTKGISKSNATLAVAYLDGTNTVLKVNSSTESAYNVDARFDDSGNAWSDNATFMDGFREKTIVYQFKIKPVQTLSLNVLLRCRHDADGDGTQNTLQTSLLTIKESGEVKAFGTTITQSFETGAWYDVAVVCSFTDGSVAIYINGSKVEGSFTIPSYDKLSDATANLNPLLRFEVLKTTDSTAEYYLDDIAVYEATAPVDQFAKTVRFSENFADENYTTTATGKAGNGMLIYQNTSAFTGTVTREADSDGNHVLHVISPEAPYNSETKSYQNTYQINARYTPTGEWGSGDNNAAALGDVTGKTIVYQFMIKINTNTNFSMILRTYNGTSGTLLYPISVRENVLKTCQHANTVTTLDTDQWYNIAVAVVYGASDMKLHVYVDGEHMREDTYAPSNYYPAQTNYMVRFVNLATENTQDFLLDNIAVYEASSIDNAIFGGYFTGNNVTLNAKLGVNFYAKLNDGVTGTVKVSNTNGSTELVSATCADAADSNGDWKHTVSVLPQNMMNVMTAGLYDADGELMDANIFELGEYVTKVQANEAYAAYHDLAAKTLKYCKAAAIHKEKYTEDGFSVAAVSPEIESYADTLIEGVTTSLVLDDACDLKIYIPAAHAEATLAIDGKEIGVVQDMCVLDEDGDYGYTVVTELLPQSYDNQYTVTVGDQVCKISVLGWMQRYIPANEESTTLNQLVWALYEYYEAANAIANAS